MLARLDFVRWWALKDLHESRHYQAEKAVVKQEFLRYLVGQC